MRSGIFIHAVFSFLGITMVFPNQGDKENVLAGLHYKSISAELKPGDVHPNAKYLEYDELSPFCDGAAVIRKGNAFALMDKSGNLVVPFNKWKIEKQSMLYASNSLPYGGYGLFEVSNVSGERGVVDPTGKVFVFKTGWSKPIVLQGGLAAVKDPANLSVHILTVNGIKYSFKTNDYDGIFNTVGSLNNGLFFYKEQYKTLYGYKNLKNEWVIQPQFNAVRPFKEGLAIVGKLDEFGEMKYGVITPEGKNLTGFVYSNQPDDFSGGFARVMAKDMNEFNYGFINREGKLAIKHKFSDGNFQVFCDGWSIGTSGKLMDSTGKIYTKEEFAALYNLPKSNGRAPGVLFYGNNKIAVSTAISGSNLHFNMIFDLKTKKLLNAPFENLMATSSYFDPVSGFALAKLYLGKDKIGNQIFREGYINEDGVFMFVKGPGSTW